MKCEYESYSASKGKNIIEKLYPSVIFLNKICESYQEAKDVLTAPEIKATTAIRYIQPKIFIPSKYLSNLYSRYKKAEEEYQKSNSKYLESFRLAFLDCPICHSKLAIQYFKDNHNNICPVCDNDFRPVLSQERTQKKAEIMNDLQKMIAEQEEKEKRKITDKKETLWLVRYIEA